MKKIIYVLMGLIIIISPKFLQAEIPDDFKNLPIYEKNNNYYIDVNVVNPQYFIDNYCVQENKQWSDIENCRDQKYFLLINMLQSSLKLDENYFYNVNSTAETITIYNKETSTEITTYLNFKDAEIAIVKSLATYRINNKNYRSYNVLPAIKYTLAYNENKNKILYNRELNTILSKNGMTIEIDSNLTNYPKQIKYNILKNGVIYFSDYIYSDFYYTLHVEPITYEERLDELSDEYIKETISKLLKNYFKNSTITIGTLNRDTKQLAITIDSIDFNFNLIVDKNKMYDFNEHNETYSDNNIYLEDINNQFSVDTAFITEDVTNKVKLTNINIESAYELKLNELESKKTVTNFDNNVMIYLPTNKEKLVGAEVTVNYYKDYLSKGEKLKGSIVNYNNKTYVKIETNKVGIYAIDNTPYLGDSLKDLPITIIDNDHFLITFDTVDPKIIVKESHMFDLTPEYKEKIFKEAYVSIYDSTTGNYKEVTDPDERKKVMTDEWYNKYIEQEKNGYVNSIIDLYVKKVNPKAEILYALASNTRNTEILYTKQYNKKDFESATNILNKIKDKYETKGLRAINSIRLYGAQDAVFENNDKALYIFDDFKEYVMSVPEEYDFVFSIGGTGGGNGGGGNEVTVGIVKDGTLLNVGHTSFSYEYFLYVDKKQPGTTLEKGLEILKKYFKNLPFEYKEVEGYKDDCLIDYSEEECGEFIELTIDGKFTLALIKEKEDYKIEDNYVRSNDEHVAIESDSYDVAPDTVVKSENVSDNKELKHFGLESAFDIKLIQLIGGIYKKNIDGTVTVYLPTIRKNIGEKVKIYYIKDDYTIGETLIGEVVKYNNKYMIKFETNHFSIYGIEKMNSKINSEEIENPQTGDNIYNSFIILVTSILSISLIIISQIKKQKNNY